MLYSYPFYLITADQARNTSVYSKMLNEMYQYLDNKETKVNELLAANPSINIGHLTAVMAIEKNITKLLLLALSANYEVLNSELPTMDKYRMKEKAKQLLATARNYLRSLMTPYYTSFEMHDLIAKNDDWDSHPVFKSSTTTVSDMNSVVLMKMSLIHRHVSYTLYAIEQHVLSGTHNHDANKVLADVSSSVTAILTQFTGYTKFINGL